MSDQRLKFIFDDLPVRGTVVQVKDSLTQVLERRDYPRNVKTLLGETLAAVVLLSSTLKLEGSLILQARSQGPLSLLMAECNQAGEVRAIAELNEQWHSDDETLAFAQLLTDGQLVLTIDHQGQRYQGIVPLDKDTLAYCLEDYFLQSEQLPTRLWLACDSRQAGGLMLQVLPEGAAEHPQREDAFTHAVYLAATIRPEELISLPSEELLHRLYHQDRLLMLPPDNIIFRCSCSRDRTISAALSLGIKEVQHLLDENSGVIDVSCHFCGQQYALGAADFPELHILPPHTRLH